jgi:hypothetical protein
MLKLMLRFWTRCLAGLRFVRTKPVKRDLSHGERRLSIAQNSAEMPLPNVTPESAEQVKMRPHCPTCTCGNKKVYQSNAERQKAYRERHAGS